MWIFVFTRGKNIVGQLSNQDHWMVLIYYILDLLLFYACGRHQACALPFYGDITQGLEGGRSWSRIPTPFFMKIPHPTFLFYCYPTSRTQFWQIPVPGGRQILNPTLSFSQIPNPVNTLPDPNHLLLFVFPFNNYGLYQDLSLSGYTSWTFCSLAGYIFQA